MQTFIAVVSFNIFPIAFASGDGFVCWVLSLSFIPKLGSHQARESQVKTIYDQISSRHNTSIFLMLQD